MGNHIIARHKLEKEIVDLTFPWEGIREIRDRLVEAMERSDE